MSGGARYWNEETQRWEDSEGGQAGAPVTPPPPAMPDRAPGWPPAGPRTAAEGGSVPPDPVPPESVPPMPSAPFAPAAPEQAPAAPPAPWPDPSGAPHGSWPGASAGPPGGPGGLETGGGGAGWSSPEWPVPTVPPGPAQARTGGPSRRTVWAVVVGAAVVGVATSLVLTLVVGSDDHDRPAPAAGSPSASAVTDSPAPSGDPSGSASPSPEETTPSASASPLPADWESYDDAEGFRIARPKGWSRSSLPSSYGIRIVNYRSPDREHRLQIYQVAEASPDESFATYLSGQTAKPPGFKKLALLNLDEGDFVGSRMEYVADSIRNEPDVGRWHVYDERFMAVDGRIYAVAAYGPDKNGGADELRLLDTALSGFCPPDTGCDAPMD
ncbi:hypothetical protein [Streptomyces sp. NPDC002250]|uniref:hypothetical protein n=1 Tax=Streptomyces sp. NPDC002250 TaxID=3364641 RepID=UPI0036C8333E